MYRVVFYRDARGREPVREWIDELRNEAGESKAARVLHRKISACLDALAEKGTWIGEPFVKKIEGEIWELRPLNNRILFFAWRGDTFVMLHRFIKKTRKTPNREIEQAKRNMEDFIERGSEK